MIKRIISSLFIKPTLINNPKKIVTPKYSGIFKELIIRERLFCILDVEYPILFSYIDNENNIQNTYHKTLISAVRYKKLIENDKLIENENGKLIENENDKLIENENDKLIENGKLIENENDKLIENENDKLIEDRSDNKQLNLFVCNKIKSQMENECSKYIKKIDVNSIYVYTRSFTIFDVSKPYSLSFKYSARPPRHYTTYTPCMVNGKIVGIIPHEHYDDGIETITINFHTKKEALFYKTLLENSNRKNKIKNRV